MALRQRSISLPIVLASVAVLLSIALLVGWTVVFSNYIVDTRSVAGGVSLLVLGIISFVIIMVVMIVIAVFLVREILDSRKQYRFIDSVTHELKSPLASMRMSAETLSNPRLQPEQRDRLREMILNDVERLSVFIDDILTAGRLELRSEPLQLTDTDVAVLVSECVENVRRRYLPDVPEIVVRVPDDLTVRTDRTSVATILTNLLDNAVKYSDPPRRVEVTVAMRGESRVVFSVVDNGIGISPKELRRVRRRFYRVASEAVRQRHGTGLGLYVVNGLCSRLDGKLRISSPGEGKGTRMDVTLPATRRQTRGRRSTPSSSPAVEPAR